MEASFQFVSILLFFQGDLWHRENNWSHNGNGYYLSLECCAWIKNKKGHVPQISYHRKRYIIFILSSHCCCIHLGVYSYVSYNLIDIIELFVSNMYCGCGARPYTVKTERSESVFSTSVVTKTSAFNFFLLHLFYLFFICLFADVCSVHH